MAVAEAKSTHSQQHQTAESASLVTESDRAFFSESSTETPAFFNTDSAPAIQAQSNSESAPFFQPAGVPAIQAKCGSCEAEGTQTEIPPTLQRMPAFESDEANLQAQFVQRMPAFESDETIRRQPSSEVESITSTPANLQPKCAACETEEEERSHEKIEGDTSLQKISNLSSADDDSDPEKSPVQFSLKIGQPGDIYEREADAMAERVVNTPDTELQSKLEQPGAEISPPEHDLQTKPILQKADSGTPTGGEQIANQLNDNKGKGSPLDEATRNRMEPAFGADFSNVRVHTDSNAAQLSKDLGAQAFTHGSDIYFNSGKYNPESSEGKHLIAHELTHTLQQTSGSEIHQIAQRQTLPRVNNTAREADVKETSKAFSRVIEQTLGLEEGYVENPDRSDLGLPPEDEVKQRKSAGLAEVATATEQLRKETVVAAEEEPKVSKKRLEPAKEPQDFIMPEAEPEAVATEVEAARVPIEGMSLSVDEINGPGPESKIAMNRLRSAPDIDPSFVQFGEAIDERIASLREHVANQAAQSSQQLQSKATTERGAIQGSIGASQATVSGIMANTRIHVADSKGTAQENLTQEGEIAHTRNAETIEAETTRLQENIDGSVEEARGIFSDADEEVRSTGEREAQRGQTYASTLAQRAREMGRSEAGRYRRTEEDTELGEDKANAVIGVANRFARQLESDGRNLRSDVLDQTEESREQVTAEEEPTVSGLEEVGPGAVESIEAFLGSVDEAADTIIQQGSDQLTVAETGSLREIDNLDRATQGRGEALLAEGEAGLDAALAAGLLSQANLAGQAGQLLDDTGRNTINQLVEVGTTGAPYENLGDPVFVQRQEEVPGTPPPTEIPQATQDEVVGQLDQVGPSLGQAANTQTSELAQSLEEATSGASQAGNAWVGETQGNMDSLTNVADTGLTEIADGAGEQLDTTIEQGEMQAATEVDQISDDVSSNVEQVRESVDSGVNEATDSLRSGVEEGNAHADETFGELPEQMKEAAEAQESFFGRVGHWFSEQLAETWQAIKGMADWGFILDLVIGIVVGVLVAFAVAALIGTGVGALLVAGALAGAAGFAAAQVSANVRHGDPLFKDVGRAAILGAFVGFGAALAGPGVLGLGLLAGTGVVMLSAGIGAVVANLATGREWDEHLLSTVLIVGVFHAVMKPVMARLPIRLPNRRGPAPAEEPPGEVPPAPERPAPRPSETPPAGMSPELQAIRNGLTDPRAIEAFDAKFQKLGGDSTRMETVIGAMERGGKLQERLIGEWDRANPEPQAPRGEAINEVPGVKNRAQQLRAEAEEYLNANPEVRSDLLTKTDAQIARLDSMLQGKVEATTDAVNRARAALRGLEGELRSAQESRGVTGTGRKFPYSGGEVEIDTVANRGRTWIDVKNREPFGLESNEGKTWAKYEAQASRQLRAARENPVDGSPPRIIWDWQNGVGADVASALTRMGITVRGQRVHVPPPPITPPPSPEHEE